jgi:RNA polymerase sigma-70 factor, ECF subfamily
MPMAADPTVELEPRQSANDTLGDLLYSDPTKHRISETEWIAVVQAIAAQDARAMRILYERTHRLVFTLSLRITSSRETAEEVMLDVFHDVWRRAGEYDAAGGTVIGWILIQARSRALDRLRHDRRQKRVNPFPEDPLASQPGSDTNSAVEQRDRFRQLRSAIGTLTAEERSAIEAAYLSEMTHVEVAARLNQPLGTIKTRIRSGIQKLRRMMDADWVES